MSSIFSLISLLWPLLPFKIPSPVGPKMTAFLMGLGVPITEKSADVDHVPPPMVEGNFDPTRYFGRWFEIARLPLKFESSCAGDVTATYTPMSDGSGQLGVINSCRSVDGGYEVAEGVGKLADSGSPAKLKVTFAPSFMRVLPFVWATTGCSRSMPTTRSPSWGRPIARACGSSPGSRRSTTRRSRRCRNWPSHRAMT